MKLKILKTIGFILLCISILIGGLFIYIYFTQPISIYEPKVTEYNMNPVLDKELTVDEVKEDIESMIDIMESSHPIFLEEVPEEYYKAKEDLLSNSDKAMYVAELQNIISKYLSSIDDGHTALWWSEKLYLDINWRYEDGKLRLLDENNLLTDKVVTKIGGVEIGVIISKIEEMFPAENYVAEAKNISNYSKGKLLLENAGVKFLKKIYLTIEDNDGEEELEVEFTRNPNDGYHMDYSIYSNKYNENIAYIKLGICEVNSSLDKVIEDINKYISEGVSNFIVDVADNPGGNSQACSMILEALNINPGYYGGVIRFSPLAQEQRGYLRKSGYVKHKNNNISVENEDINLYVITNENTFSSSQMLAVWVSDGDLGTIVGRSSSNMPSCYGDILTFQLENSKIKGQISHKKWTRPDKTKDDERVLNPDVYVEYGEDILEKTMEVIENNK
ncbi:C-terminal processing peptidase [uncultured Clostridium sp.]|uniref:S41 family peptidase n=1 Tax=uncultured Clostridium sp. TaxID=59620 RepID=UPI0008213447|nr:S41 family peptidase [uncultured Clostridium sp.]SCJ93353.1 C-terminal processing peptidase [uncultured Clostridium sp.]